MLGKDLVFVCIDINILQIGPVSEFRRQIFLDLLRDSYCLGDIQALVPVLFLCLFLGKILIIFFLLQRCQRFVLLLQLHCLVDILAFGEPQNQVIAFSKALFSASRFVIQCSQFIGPLLDVFDPLEISQCLDLVIKRKAFCLLNLVTQNILIRILRRQIDILFIAILRFIGIAEL